MNNSIDTDQDGIVDCEDNCPWEFNPKQADCDGNGKGDACDTCNINITSIPSNNIPPGGSVRVTASTDPSSMEVEWQIDPGNGVTIASDDIIKSGKTINITNIKGQGFINITASNSGYSACNKSITVIVGCESCKGSTCDNIDNSSVKARIGLGKTNHGQSSGALHLYSKTPRPDLAKPQMLKLSAPGNDTKAIYSDEAVRQIKTPQYFVDILPDNSGSSD